MKMYRYEEEIMLITLLMYLIIYANELGLFEYKYLH